MFVSIKQTLFAGNLQKLSQINSDQLNCLMRIIFHYIRQGRIGVTVFDIVKVLITLCLYKLMKIPFDNMLKFVKY